MQGHLRGNLERVSGRLRRLSALSCVALKGFEGDELRCLLSVIVM